MKTRLEEKMIGVVVEHGYTWSPDIDAQKAGDIRPGTVKLDFSDLTLSQVLEHATRHVTYRQVQPKLKKGEKLPDVVKVTALGTRRAMTEAQRDEKELAKMHDKERIQRLIDRAEAQLKELKAKSKSR